MNCTRLQLREDHQEGDTIKGFKTFLGDFDRPNLQFIVIRKPSNAADAMLEVLKHLPPSSSQVKCLDSDLKPGNSIVYCYSQKECETVANFLSTSGKCDNALLRVSIIIEFALLGEIGIRSAPYHAGLEEEYRCNVQDAWVAVCRDCS